MRHLLCAGPAFLCLVSVVASGQVVHVSADLGSAARQVILIRQHMQSVAVAEGDPKVPPALAVELAQLKEALTRTAVAAFSSSPASTGPEEIQKALADALHIDGSAAPEAVETKGKQDLGAYGADLSVQVLPLFSGPKLYEVDFRYGIECGDDHLLLVFESKGDRRWQPLLRWDARAYTTVADAFGDFVLLTPLTGSYKTPTWRFMVAHGHPGCDATPRPSRFDLDLIAPTADVARPRVDWHFDQPYTQDTVVTPRLATTEDTIDFRLAAPASKKDGTAAPSRNGHTYSFHLTGDGRIEPTPATGDPASDVDAATPRSPQ